MGKDPAVLFYTSDFLTATTLFTDEQIGQYIKLLCQQHQLGHLPEEHMLKICKTYDSPVFAKFTKDTEGRFYNVRMEEEQQRRVSYSNSRRLNRISKEKPPEDMSNHMSIHMETETETDTITKNVDEIYKLYPSHSKGRLKVAKSLKDKEKIAKILKTKYPLKMAVESILKDEYPKDLATFLNHLPDPDTLEQPTSECNFPTAADNLRNRQ
jgi:hypothetical protein